MGLITSCETGRDGDFHNPRKSLVSVVLQLLVAQIGSILLWGSANQAPPGCVKSRPSPTVLEMR